ncbi:MAG TPA: TonB-dependent receptor, partial [Bacteroidales bacterium]|nr:TonB-dependent receptor [Bacteroidales bacterium]
MKNIYILIFLSIFLIDFEPAFSQETKKAVAEMTKEELSALSYQDLMNLSLEDLMTVANKFGLSADEILEYFLNKDVTSASKRAEKSISSPLSTTVISRDEILNSGATSIPEALRLVPGMIVRQKTNGNYDVHIRGNDNLPPKGMFVYSENSISLIMIDGRPVYNYSFGGTFWETLPVDLNDIDRIEVIRGPASALYGPNAVSGAVNIITLNPEDNKMHASGQVQVGNANTKIGQLAVSKGFGNFKMKVSGNYTHFDRFQDDFYVFDLNKSYSAAQIDTMCYRWKPGRNGLLIEDNFDKKVPDPSLGVDKYGLNAFLKYDINNDFGVNVSMGLQSSEILSNSLGNHEIALIGRTSDTRYIDLRSHAYGFQLQANYMQGDQYVQKENPGWHIMPKVLNTSLEYEKTFGSLVLRPGISYQRTTYDDSKWVDASQKAGFLNGEKEINCLAYFLRADYKMFDKLRLIGAIRGDKYNNPNKTYFTYQFISSFDINENNVVRAVYSRANRGPFIADTYADYYWPIIDNYYTLVYSGNTNLRLPVMDMIELGYRVIVSKNVMIDLEAFHTELKDLSFFSPDSTTMYFDISPLALGQAPSSRPSRIEGHGMYYNSSLKSIQNGVTVNVSVAVNQKLNFKVFATIQQSKVKDFYPRTIWNDFDSLSAACAAKYKADLYNNILPALAKGDLSPLTPSVKKYSAA